MVPVPLWITLVFLKLFTGETVPPGMGETVPFRRVKRSPYL